MGEEKQVLSVFLSLRKRHWLKKRIVAAQWLQFQRELFNPSEVQLNIQLQPCYILEGIAPHGPKHWIIFKCSPRKTCILLVLKLWMYGLHRTCSYSCMYWCVCLGMYAWFMWHMQSCWCTKDTLDGNRNVKHLPFDLDSLISPQMPWFRASNYRLGECVVCVPACDGLSVSLWSVIRLRTAPFRDNPLVPLPSPSHSPFLWKGPPCL